MCDGHGELLLVPVSPRCPASAESRGADGPKTAGTAGRHDIRRVRRKDGGAEPDSGSGVSSRWLDGGRLSTGAFTTDAVRDAQRSRHRVETVCGHGTDCVFYSRLCQRGVTERGQRTRGDRAVLRSPGTAVRSAPRSAPSPSGIVQGAAPCGGRARSNSSTLLAVCRHLTVHPGLPSGSGHRTSSRVRGAPRRVRDHRGHRPRCRFRRVPLPSAATFAGALGMLPPFYSNARTGGPTISTRPGPVRGGDRGGAHRRARPRRRRSRCPAPVRQRARSRDATITAFRVRRIS